VEARGGINPLRTFTQLLVLVLGEKERKVVYVRCGLHIPAGGRRRCGGGVGGAAAISPLKRILAFPWERRPRGGGVFQ